MKSYTQLASYLTQNIAVTDHSELKHNTSIGETTPTKKYMKIPYTSTRHAGADHIAVVKEQLYMHSRSAWDTFAKKSISNNV